MLKLPKGLKKKKKGKKSKRKGEDELFTEEELEKYRREHQKQENTGESSIKENEEWSKFKDLTTGIDSVLKKTQGDLDRIKSTSFFQKVETKVVETIKTDAQQKSVVEITEADFPHLASTVVTDNEEKSEYGLTDDDSEEEEQDDIFDTSFVDAVERGEVKLAHITDLPEDFQDDSIFDTSHVDAIIRGTENKSSKGKKSLDIGVAVEVLTGRIDNVTVKTTKRTKRVIPGDLLLENSDKDFQHPLVTSVISQEEKSILDIDADIPNTSPIDLSVSLHTSLIQHSKNSQEYIKAAPDSIYNESDEIDEFTLLATESLENESAAIKLNEKKIIVEPIIEKSWSAFEANKNEAVFAECIIEDQIDIVDPYIDQDDPFDTSFADAVVPLNQKTVKDENYFLEEDDDFDPRAEEVKAKLNNRRKSSVRIHLITPSGLCESLTSDDVVDKEHKELSDDLLGGSATDLTKLSDTPLYPVDVNSPEIDPFDTTIVDKIVAPGKIELKFLEQELIGSKNLNQIYRVPSDPDFDPRADEPKKEERRASRPENLIVTKNVGFNIENTETSGLELKPKSIKPLTPYYTRELSITEDTNEESESFDLISDTLTKTRSDEDLTSKVNYDKKRRHSEFSHLKSSKINFNDKNILESGHSDINKVLTPSHKVEFDTGSDLDPFDTSFAAGIVPSKIELKLLAKEFSCEETQNEVDLVKSPDLLEPTDDIFQVKALTPEPSDISRIVQDLDPFDTSFTGDLNPGKTELKLLESEFLN